MPSNNTWQTKSLTSIIVLLICCALPLGFSLTQGATSVNSPPALQWQQQYGNARTASVSNLTQTSDGGYAFLDDGWLHSITLAPSVFYKVNSSGNINWQKTVDNFRASSFIETSDEGYQISGAWDTFGTPNTPYQYVPTILKLDRAGNLQWRQNTTKENPLENNHLNATQTSPVIKTSDDGYAYAIIGGIVKTDANGAVEWIKNMTYTYPVYPHSDFPLSISCLIEASDGSLVGVGTGSATANYLMGYIFLIKTEPFLPLPSPTPPLPTPIPYESQNTIALLLVIFGVTAVIVATILILIYKAKRSHRKIMPV